MKKNILYLLLAIAAPMQAQTEEPTAPTAEAPATAVPATTQTVAPAATQATAPAVSAVATTANPLRFGYFSYDAALKASAGYAAAQQSLESLREKYAAELKRVEDEFNKKYEDFLDGQRSFAPSILQKRQAELQELMEKNIAFKKETARLLDQAEQDALRPLKEKIAAAVNKIGHERRLAFIANTDANALPFVDPSMGEDLTAAVSAAVQ